VARRQAARYLAAGLLVLAILVSHPSPASAHIVIRLDIRAPQPGALVGRDTDVVIYAQPMLAGVQETTFLVSLDGHSIDPVSGQRQPQPVPTVIRVLSAVRVPLRGLAAGPHLLTVSYQPDLHMLLMTASVSFRVGARGSHGALFLALGGVAGVAVLTAGLFVLRRRSMTTTLRVEENGQATAARPEAGGSGDPGRDAGAASSPCTAAESR